MNRIWHPYTEWEEYHAGMWRKVDNQEENRFLSAAVEFTGDAELYGKNMIRVINEWPISCEHNLSNVSINRRAWIGHAACCIAFGCPEYIVRKAWWRLSDEQRRLANDKADEAIREWEQRYEKKGETLPSLQYREIDLVG